MIPKLEDCKSPLRPTRYNLVVAIDVIGKTSAGGIIIPEQIQKREDSGADKGRVVAISPMAFKGADWGDEPDPPRVGDVILFQRYDGKEIEMADDTVKYRVITDDAVKGIIAD